MHRPNTLQAALAPARTLGLPQPPGGAATRQAVPSQQGHLTGSAQPAGPHQAPAPDTSTETPAHHPAVPGAGGARQEGLQSRTGEEEGDERQEGRGRARAGPTECPGLPGTTECPAL